MADSINAMKISELPQITESELTHFRVGAIKSAEVLEGPIDFQPFQGRSIQKFKQYKSKCTESQLLKIRDGIFIGGTQNVFSLLEGVHFNPKTEIEMASFCWEGFG
jgi:hypothetical protein